MDTLHFVVQRITVRDAMQNTTVRDRLNEARRLRGVTQQDIADELGVKQSAVSHWSTGRNDPSNEDLAKIAAFLRVRAAWLILGDGPMEADPTPVADSTPKKRRASTKREKPTHAPPQRSTPRPETRAA